MNKLNLDKQEAVIHALVEGCSVGAADLRLELPAAAGTVRANVNGGAADINIVIPEGVEATITKSFALSSVDVDGRRFPKFGDIYESPGYDSAENRVELPVNVGAANVTIR
jgi:hypothetical protein